MELFQSLIPYLIQTIVILLLFAINHFYVKDIKKMLKYIILVMLPFIAIIVLLSEFGFLP